jgi:hypothetical protein
VADASSHTISLEGTYLRKKKPFKAIARYIKPAILAVVLAEFIS